MAEIIHLHKGRNTLRPKERSFVQAGRDATILMFTGVRYERGKPGSRVAKTGGKRIRGR
jgi:hypothetical protein